MTATTDARKARPAFRELDTKLIHAGAEPIRGAVCTPIFQSANFVYAGETSYHDIRYIRLNNTPNHDLLHRKLAALENAESALVTGSGMAAISTALLSVLRSGDHLLAQQCLYGGTHSFITADLPRYGIEYDLVDGADPDAWRRLLRPTTRAFYIETLANPLLTVPDIDAVVEFAREHDLVTLIDNTVASPVNFRPTEWGIDLSLHSGTKYLNGHSDIVAGAVIGSSTLVTRVTHQLNHLGGSLDPHACFLLDRGLKTLGVRVRHQNASTLTLARFLETHPQVTRLHYAGLESHPSHDRAMRYLDGYSGLLSFELAGGVEAADRFIERLRIGVHAGSLGGVETLVSRPAILSHAGLSPAERSAIGVTDGLIRMSIGLEDVGELQEDLTTALD